jgi:hypothetical protein
MHGHSCGKETAAFANFLRVPVNWASYVDYVQWPAMLTTVIASWYVASTVESRRNWGFWVFLASNVLWVVWGLSARAYALIALQVCLAAMNIRGARKTETSGSKH